MAKINLSFDIEPDLHTEGKEEYRGVYEGIPAILNILNKHKIKGTFFVTCDCIEKYPKIFQDLIKKGHEISLHAYRHQRFDDLSLKEKEDQIKKSVACFKKYLKTTPQGFRAPQHSVDNSTLKLLNKYGFLYDSSKTPLNAPQFIFFPKRIKRNFQGFFSRPYKYKIKDTNLLEIPTTSFLLPFVSLLIRVFPINLQKLYVSILRLFFKNIIFYAHSWDFVELKESHIDQKFPHTYFINNLDTLISYMIKKNKFVKIEELL